jgi:hypothetical protein
MSAQKVDVSFKVKHLWLILGVIMVILTVIPVYASFAVNGQVPNLGIFVSNSGNGGGGGAGSSGLKPNCGNPCTIIILNSQFGASTGSTNPYIVTAGTTVTWANHDGTDHTSTSDNSVWGSPVLAPGVSFSFTFSSPGVYTYHCLIHPMTGEIIVVP